MKLSALYHTIAQKASETTAWPDSTSFKRLLLRENVDSPLRPPVFEAGTGPLSLIALFTPASNPAALPLIHDCLSIFNDFVSDLPENSTVIYSKVPHVCVSVFQEHPSMLSDEDKVHWRHVTDSDIGHMIEDFDAVFASMKEQIRLRLDSILLTPDGAMIAGFDECPNNDDDDDDNDDPTEGVVDSFKGLKQQCTSIGRRRIGALTSRPKNLIHVTLGRVLDMGGGGHHTTSTNAAGIDGGVVSVARWNDAILPQRVSQLPVREWTLDHVSLLRNKVWLCEETEIYKTWSLRK